MKEKKWIRVIYIIGIIAFIMGTIDPLEGSVLIAAGILMITLAAFAANDRHMKIFLIAAILIIIGVFFMFYFSSLGGFGGDSSLSIWWGLLILPYPIGWLITAIILISRLIKKEKLGQGQSEVVIHSQK